MILTNLRRYQAKDAEFLAAQYHSRSEYNMGHILAGEQGCGKTITILKTIDYIQPKRVLIVCPAGARNEWKRQIGLHYSPGSFNTFIAKSTADIRAYNAGSLKAAGAEIKGIVPAASFAFAQKTIARTEILVTGYHHSLLQALDPAIKFELVIPDECQEISNPNSTTSQVFKQIVDRSDAYIIPMSGTPAEDRPEQIWHALSLCAPQEWGSDINDFRYRYLLKVPNEWAPNGYFLKGLKPERKKELETRIGKFMIRHTKKEVAPDLPPMIVLLKHVPVKQIQFDWDNPESFDKFNEQNIDVKTEETINILREATNHGESRFVVFTHLHRTAETIEGELRKTGLDVVSLIGVSADARHRKVEMVATAIKPTVLIASIEASGTAVDFTFATTAVFAEQHHVPGKTSQAAQRFHRLSSIHSTNVWFIVGEGTKEEVKAENYCRKIKDLEATYRSGEFEEKAQDALTIKDKQGLGDLI